VQSSSQIITTSKPTPNFLQAGCPSCRPTNSVKALNGEVTHYMDLLTSSSPGGLPTLSLTTNSSWLPCGRVAMTIRPMMPVVQTLFCMQQNALKYTISQFLWHGRTCSEVNGFAAVTQLTTTTKNKQHLQQISSIIIIILLRARASVSE